MIHTDIFGDTGSTLFVHVRARSEFLNIRAEIGEDTRSYACARRREAESIYHGLEYWDIVNDVLLREIGHDLFGPIRDLIESASEVVFVIPSALVELPLDLLAIEGTPLFLLKPVSFALTNTMPRSVRFSPDCTALIIRDPSADPDNGTYFLKRILPSANYFDVDEIDIARVRSLPKKDIVLISAHGQVGQTSTDFLELGDERLLPRHFTKLSPRLVYLDSCQLGISTQFIKHLQKVGTSNYIAPITSNEAGNSSTRTIEAFFEALQNGYAPSTALFRTRTALYRLFEADGFNIRLWRAFPFRHYHLG